MSDQEEAFLTRAEKLFKGLENTKAWYSRSMATFVIATLTLVGSMFLNSYRIGKLEDSMSQAVSIKAFELMQKSISANTDALIELITEKDHKQIAKEFNEKCKKINDDIFQYSTIITRSGKKAP